MITAYLLLLLPLTGVPVHCNKCDLSLLHKALESLGKSLSFFQTHVTELNLDGAVATRMCADQLKVILESPNARYFPPPIILKLEKLAVQADVIATQSVPHVARRTYGETLKLMRMLEPGSWKLPYPSSRRLDLSLQAPTKCNNSIFFEALSDACIAEIYPDRSGRGESCQITGRCWEVMTSSGYKDYALTHEVLYLEVAEMNGCASKIEWLKDEYLLPMQDYLCANVYRDAVIISGAKYPKSHRDLLLEQIGVCGMLGYVDFLKRDWVELAMGWQNSNGCYKHNTRWQCTDDLREDGPFRMKREDVSTTDGCSVHMTAVAALAMTINVKFCLEYLANTQVEQNDATRLAVSRMFHTRNPLLQTLTSQYK